jgi:hypothetical protein
MCVGLFDQRHENRLEDDRRENTRNIFELFVCYVIRLRHIFEDVSFGFYGRRYFYNLDGVSFLRRGATKVDVPIGSHLWQMLGG